MKKILILLTLGFIQTFNINAQPLAPHTMVIGTYTNTGKSEGIYTYSFNPADASTTLLNKQSATDPSFLTVSANKKFIYSVNEVGKNMGGVTAYSFSAPHGKLVPLNNMPSAGDNPCYISTDRKSRLVFIANYTGGNFSAIRLRKNGLFDSIIQTIQHSGKSINTSRQEKPHVHSTVLSPNEKFLLVQDLGTDQIAVYKIDYSNKTAPISTSPVSVFNTTPGSGPRHLTFHPNKKWAYAVQELSGAVTALSFKNGVLNKLQEISMTDADEKGKSGAADIHISADGKFLYASNRGDFNNIVIYSIGEKGLLTYVASQSTLGKAPRNFAIDPTGNYLLAANQNSDEIVIFNRDQQTGLLKDSGKRIAVSRPVCIQFVVN